MAEQPTVTRGAAPVDRAPAHGDHDRDEHDNPLEVLRDLLEHFETDHPDLVKAINDVSHYLSGLGI